MCCLVLCLPPHAPTRTHTRPSWPLMDCAFAQLCLAELNANVCVRACTLNFSGAMAGATAAAAVVIICTESIYRSWVMRTDSLSLSLSSST